MEQQQISAKKLKAMEKVKRANAELAKVVREEREQLRKTQDCHKYMMGGCVVKYFPEAYNCEESLIWFEGMPVVVGDELITTVFY